MAAAVTHDYKALVHDEKADLAAFLHTLESPQWDAPSLCEGWKVRHVVSHMAFGYTTPLPVVVARLTPYRFNVPKASFDVSLAFGDSHSPDGILATLERGFARPKGFGRVIPRHEALSDHLIHQQDIRRPLGIPREIPR